MSIAESMVGVNNIAPSYEEMTKCIAMILRRRHKLTSAQADEAIRMSPFKSVFLGDPEMVAHTSNEAWAREVLAYWKKIQSSNSESTPAKGVLSFFAQKRKGRFGVIRSLPSFYIHLQHH